MGDNGVLGARIEAIAAGDVSALAELVAALRESGEDRLAERALRKAAEAVAAAVGRPRRLLVRPACPGCGQADGMRVIGHYAVEAECGDGVLQDWACGRCGGGAVACVEYRPHRWWAYNKRGEWVEPARSIERPGPPGAEPGG
jgi:hypothetical protein